MKLFPLTLTSLAVLLSYNSVVDANFDLYSGWLNYYDGNQQGYYRIWQMFDSDPTCDNVYNTRYVYNTDDVSGGVLGVRCEAGWNNAGCYDMILFLSRLWKCISRIVPFFTGVSY